MDDRIQLTELCRTIHEAIDCDLVALGRMHRATGRYQAVFWPPLAPAEERRFRRVFLRHGLDHPRLRAFLRGEGVTGVATWPQLDPAGKFLASGLYRNFYEPRGITDQLSFGVSGPGSIAIGVTVDRAGGRFTDDEIARLDAALACVTAVADDGGSFVERVMRAFERVTATGTDVLEEGTTDPALTDRQEQIAELLVEGLPNKQIAARLGISPGTVRSHVQEIYRRLDVHTRAAAVAYLLSRD